MPNYLCLQRSLPGGAPEREAECAQERAADASTEAPSPARMQAMHARFDAWRKAFADNIVDFGGKLGGGQLVTASAPDGPFVEVKELVGGYMILSADSLEAAVEIIRAFPGLVRPGSGCEVVEIQTP